MLRYLYGTELFEFPLLASTMFRDRTHQFKTRLRWPVQVNERGEERDAYDALNPLYVIWQQPDGCHGGSLRFLPTTGRTMLYEAFASLTIGHDLINPLIWECTRFCLSPGASAQVSAALMLGGVEVGLQRHLSHAVGVFDARMVRIYQRLGWGPTVLADQGQGPERISLGLWDFDAEIRHKLHQKTGISADQSSFWLRQCARPAQRISSIG